MTAFKSLQLDSYCNWMLGSEWINHCGCDDRYGNLKDGKLSLKLSLSLILGTWKHNPHWYPWNTRRLGNAVESLMHETQVNVKYVTELFQSRTSSPWCSVNISWPTTDYIQSRNCRWWILQNFPIYNNLTQIYLIWLWSDLWHPEIMEGAL